MTNRLFVLALLGTSALALPAANAADPLLAALPERGPAGHRLATIPGVVPKLTGTDSIDAPPWSPPCVPA